MIKSKYSFTSHKILVIAGIALLLMAPLFIKTPYILHIMVLTFYMGSASLSWSILGGMTGQTSLGHAAFMGLGAYTSALLLTKAGVSPWICMVISFVLVGILSVIMFYPCFILKGPYFTLVTIAFGEAFRNLFTNWEFVGKGQGIRIPYQAEESFVDMRFSTKIPYYFIALFMFAMIYIVIRVIDRSRLGYALKTVREDEDTASAIGINPLKYKLIATFLSAGFTAVCGVFYAQYIRFIDPDIMMQTYSVEYVLP
ncbi:MAG: branched-chain amino acid ABC transporter permease, partial [Oscillospiraceae bacterium]